MKYVLQIEDAKARAWRLGIWIDEGFYPTLTDALDMQDTYSRIGITTRIQWEAS